MDESLDHEPTLIERGMGVHLNHPITARRGIRNPRPDRWGLRKPHPPSRGGTARERSNTSRRARPDRLERAQARGLDAWLHLLGCIERRQRQSCACGTPRSAGTLQMPVEISAPHAGGSRDKSLQEHSRSCRASGARSAGPLTRPHGIALETRREERPISKCQHLQDPNGYTCRCSGATVGDSHKGPLNNQGKPS
jgi:hypothetical protein